MIRGDAGFKRRARFERNVTHLRSRLVDLGYRLLGRPSAVVPVIVGDVAYGRILSKYTLRRGGIVNLVEYPAVSAKSSRLRLQVMADHTLDDIEEFLQILDAAQRDALIEYHSFVSSPGEPANELTAESMVVPRGTTSLREGSGEM